jgi:hypothetical protein
MIIGMVLFVVMIINILIQFIYSDILIIHQWNGNIEIFIIIDVKIIFLCIFI